jgi:hypothetical protein
MRQSAAKELRAPGFQVLRKKRDLFADHDELKEHRMPENAILM